MKMCMIWTLLNKLQCAAIYTVIGCFVASWPLYWFCWVPVPSVGTWESYGDDSYRGPSQSIKWIFLGHLDYFGQFSRYCGWGVTLWSGNALLSPKNLAYDRFMKSEWLITNVIAIKSPTRAESELFWVILGIFRSIQAAIMVGETLCDQETLSWGLKALRKIIWWK